MKPGTYVALPTPFADGLVDELALREIIRHVLSGGVDGIVACGTTGESPTLSQEEWTRVVEICVEEGACSTTVLAGTGTNCTRTTVARTVLARKLGVSAALVVVPYYNKPGQEGLVRHFQAVADDGGLPLVLYNIPGRTGLNLEPDIVCGLSHHPGVVGIKEASGCLDAVSEILGKARDGFMVLSGDDSLSLPIYSLGGHGVISTTGNVAPRLMSEMYRRFAAGDVSWAREAHYRLLPLFRALFVESNPAPLKFALSRMGFMTEEVRLPLVPVGPSTRTMVDEALRLVGVQGRES